MSESFPFTAIVNQERMKRALVLNAVNPDIGGVLIRGERGTAKSTAVRALADVLPDQEVVTDCPYGCPPTDPERMCGECRQRRKNGELLSAETRPMRVVDLPLNATEDRVTGTLDLEAAVTEGRQRFEPGILAAANRNVLYVDEVNLLDDHIVDVLLDAAAMGENVVEREGVSHRHPAEFVLVGTMNPEEGPLRPQLLDRFGLVVDVKGVEDVDERIEISDRRGAFDADPAAFRDAYAEEERDLTRRIVDARDRLDDVTVPDDIATAISESAVDHRVPGLRGDIAVRRTAATIAAFDGAGEVRDRDLAEAQTLALAHRLPTDMRAATDAGEAVLLPDDAEPEEVADTADSADEGSDGRVPINGGRNDLITDAETTYPIDRTAIDPPQDRTLRDDYGRRVPSKIRMRSGRYVGARRQDDVDDVAIDATVRAAARRQHRRSDADSDGIDVWSQDLRQAIRERNAEALLVLVVDASGSVMNGPQMRETKRAVLSLLEDAYRTRDRVAVVAFRGQSAQVYVDPTRNVDRARRRVSELRVGGNTPLCHGLASAYDLVERERRRNEDVYPLVVVFSDGKANVPYNDGADPETEALRIASAYGEADIETAYVDTGYGLNDAKYSLWSDEDALAAKREEFEWNRTLADAMDGQYVPLIELPDGEYIES
ncbi:VWA domain-containing protein [Halostella sp. PRR32]|uniref:VWA domain-containing protein n=1 Tax=Halostella sp. PRR32 TaxID=3098147 RepID=UPI002B1D2EAE|nr:VWA domain-containing protein [Halostella sp. PRR32]